MKTDAEVQLYMRERKKGKKQETAAARAEMCERTARKYEKAKQLPSQLKKPRTHRTRANPFEEDWPWVVQQLERDPALQGTTLFAELCEKYPERYQPLQVRTLQRHIANWRALYGPEKEVIFEQIHRPGERSQTDFTHMDDLDITLASQPFPHLLYHFVLTYSNVEAVSLCFSESFEALADGLEKALWQIGGVPAQHRTDHLSAAIRRLDQTGREDFTERYQSLMKYYGLKPTWNNAGVAHENGDVEQSHYRFKEALDQTLRIRGNRDFQDRKSYEQFLEELVRKRNQTRQGRFATEQAALQPLPMVPLEPVKEVRVTVSRFSTIMVLGNTYSVPSRLIETTLTVRIKAECLKVYVGDRLTETLPRLLGRQQQAINYRHVIWSLVRKPGAFADYRYRDEMFPSLAFRRAYDRLQEHRPGQAAREYLKVLHLAATSVEQEVETALLLLEEAHKPALFESVRELVRLPGDNSSVQMPKPDLGRYDQLLESRRCAND